MKEASSERINSIVRTLCEAEDKNVVLRFDEPMTAPDSKYNGRSYQTKTLPKATLRATVNRASVEDAGETLICSAKVSSGEMERVGINPSAVRTEGDDDKYCVVDISTTRQWWSDEYDDLTREEAERAIELGREEEVLPPWDEPPTVRISVGRTSDCMKRHYDTGFSLQYSSPEHEIGSLIDLRVK